MSNQFIVMRDKDDMCEIFLNGINIKKVLDFSYNKSSAGNPTELTIKLDVDEIQEVFKENSLKN